MRLLAAIVLGILLGHSSLANTVEERLYINRGQLMLVDSTYVPHLAFNASPTYSSQHAQVDLMAGDTLRLTVLNNDSLTHGFDISGMITADTMVAGDSLTFTIPFPSQGAYIFNDHHQYPRFTYMGLAGMITVANANHARFKWNIKELQKSWTLDADTNPSRTWTNYYPNYFTVNGWSAPLIDQDSSAKVIGAPGDTLLIFMANTGRSAHSMHFHGYHCDIVYSSKAPHHVGRSKDTFPLYSMETMVLRLVPDKPGEFPVHDHNLVAVSAGNFYPNGMFMTLLIQ